MLEGFPYKDALLPKIWLQKIPGFGELVIPESYPASSSEFSLDFTQEDKDVIAEMEANLDTEESIITTEMIPERENLGNYVGTFDVTGEAGVETLLSPVRLADTAIGAIAMHYNEESAAWEQVEDAHVVDGYVYGTLESFSPIAVFELRRDTYIDETKYATATPKALVCNGIPVYIHKDEEDNVVAVDGYGKIIDMTGVETVIGGSLDGSDLDTVSVTIDGVDTIRSIRAGSFSDNLDNIAHVGKAVVTLKNCHNKSLGITGGYYGCIMDEYTLNVTDSEFSWCGAGESIWQMAPSSVTNKDAGTSDIHSKSRTKKFTLNAKNSKAVLVYLGGNCGLFYNDANEGNVENCEFDYIINGGSNGGTGESTLYAERSKFTISQTNNRGYINDVVKSVFSDCQIANLFVAGDTTDSTVTGVTNHIGKLEVNGESNIEKLWVGTQKGVSIASNDELDDLVDKIVFSRDVTYGFGDENGADLFADSIRIK